MDKKIRKNTGRLFKIAVGGSVAALGGGVALAQSGPSSPATIEAPSEHVTLDLEDGTVEVDVNEEIAPDLDADDNGVDEPTVDEPTVETVDEPSVDTPSVESVDEPSVESVDDDQGEDEQDDDEQDEDEQVDDDQVDDEQDDESASGGGDD